MASMRRPCNPAWLIGSSLLLATGCFDPGNAQSDTETETESATGSGTSPGTGPTGSATDPDTTVTESATDSGTCTTENAVDPSCGADTPYCVGGQCVDCTGLASCADVDAAAPACDEGSGLCAECSASDASACVATKSVCVDNACVPCTENTQCESQVCLIDSGECLFSEVEVTGVVYDFSTIDNAPLAGVTTRVTNLARLPESGPTDATGAYSLTGLVPGTLLDLAADFPQNDPVFVPAAITTRFSTQVPNDNPAPLDMPVVTYEYLAQVAFECGLFPTLEEAIGDGAVNTFFVQRSTVFGTLVDSDGAGVPTVSRAAIQAELGNWANFHDNLLDTDSEPAQVCFLEEDAATGTYVGTTDQLSNDSGRFVMFRVRNDAGLGQGGLTVRATGFNDTSVSLPSSGNIGVVELLRNDEPIPRDFAIDVFPVFTTYGCVGCHTAGGPPGAVHDGFEADWDLTPFEVWQNMVGPGTVCNVPDDPHRVCTNDPALSLFVTRPLTDLPGMPDVHPIDIFPSIDDPTLQVIMQWIEQGALPPSDVRFEQDIYPLFEKHACIACHTAGGPDDAVTAGFRADWDLAPIEVWENLTGPGTTCPDPANPLRICTNDPLNSLFVTYPLSDEADRPDPHPVGAFASLDHPDLQLIIQWIAQGALFEVSCEHSECTAGTALNPGCSLCAEDVCNADAFCCNTMWDVGCVMEAEMTDTCAC